MKRVIPLSILAIGLLVAYVSLSTPEDSRLYDMNMQDTDDLEFPAEVMEILKTSCYDCHTTDSKNEDGKEKLDFYKWNDLSGSKKISKLDAICRSVKFGDMPTRKYVKNYPDKALTKHQINVICDWVDDETENLKQQKKK